MQEKETKVHPFQSLKSERKMVKLFNKIKEKYTCVMYEYRFAQK